MNRFHQLYYLLPSAYWSGNTQVTSTLALEYLNLAAQNQSDWNYGNAIHQSHTVLGLLSLEQKNTEEAKSHLLQSAHVQTSPQLRGFGPNMLLAKKLLEAGESSTVLTYIDLSSKLWPLLSRRLRPNTWKKAISRQITPDFGLNLSIHLQKDEQLKAASPDLYHLLVAKN